METNKVAIYAKINANVKERSIMYLAECKLTNKRIHTFSLLLEESLDQYMIANPL